MFLTELYYELKPFLPKAIRDALRRQVVKYRLRRSHAVWPISVTAGNPPAEWSGWPGEKAFAFVLTHDVEGLAGLDKCRQLMELEMKLGVRSSFNFVPEGDYQASQELREELLCNGFEVAVHDLNHDGKLYRSRRQFEKRATRINKYLQDWNAVGFRSGYMMHRLDWMHKLNVLYDASTFDTDPFEPQPDGCNTIFPFWVAAPAAETSRGSTDKASRPGRGYVELPYTLAQDSTLFLYLRERTWDIWRRKLDWVAQQGGMAHLTVHPDYIRFENEPPSAGTYPVEFFVEFLTYVRERYSPRYWQALPREVAQFYADSRQISPAALPANIST